MLGLQPNACCSDGLVMIRVEWVLSARTQFEVSGSINECVGGLNRTLYLHRLSLLYLEKYCDNE